jgi:hypothetical protein
MSRPEFPVEATWSERRARAAKLTILGIVPGVALLALGWAVGAFQ